MSANVNAERMIAQTRCWVEQAVIELNLCPFARKPQENEQVRYVVTTAESPEELLEDLLAELEWLRATDPALVETTLLIHPYVLQDFDDYLDFLELLEAVLEEGGYRDEFQIASLHPDYCFDGVEADAAENYTNRSPYPTLHLLREAVVSEAVAGYSRPDKIPERNIRTMERLGVERLRALLAECMEAGK